MAEDEFLNHIRELLFNPTGERGSGPFAHTQWGAAVKLPSDPRAFLLFHSGGAPTGPHDYNVKDPLGGSAVPRVRQEPAYSQMQYGPRAASAMFDPYDRPGDVGNTGGRPGRRLSIKDKRS